MTPQPSSRPSPDRAAEKDRQQQSTEPRRRYNATEEAAFRACGMNPMYGPAQFAGGAYWPDELERRADRMAACATQMRIAAAALRREIAADPLTAEGVRDAS